jgi:hypothetical protein
MDSWYVYRAVRIETLLFKSVLLLEELTLFHPFVVGETWLYCVILIYEFKHTDPATDRVYNESCRSRLREMVDISLSESAWNPKLDMENKRSFFYCYKLPDDDRLMIETRRSAFKCFNV